MTDKIEKGEDMMDEDKEALRKCIMNFNHQLWDQAAADKVSGGSEVDAAIEAAGGPMGGTGE